MVRELKSHKLMEPFLEPLDPVALGLEGYTDIVKQPMDLKTIGAKNDGGEYAGLGSLAKDALKGDVELMFSNAVAYNGADHWIAGDVTQLKVVTDALFASDVAPTFPTLEEIKVMKVKDMKAALERRGHEGKGSKVGLMARLAAAVGLAASAEEAAALM